MPPRGSRLQRQKSNSEQQLNNDDRSQLSESNQKSDSEISLNKQSAGTDSEETQQQIVAIEIQKQQDALMMISQHNFNIPIYDQEEKNKDFIEAKNKIQEIRFDKIIKILKKHDYDKNQDKIIQNLHKFHEFEENDVIQIFNILNFLVECLPFFKLCRFLTKEKVESFTNEVQKLLNFNDNEDAYQKYFQNVSSFCSDFDNLFGFQYNRKIFHNIFRQNFSELTANINNSIQKITAIGKDTDYIDEYRKVNQSLTCLYISFKILMKTQRIRTAISFVDNLLKSKDDFNHFLFITDFMTDKLLVTISDQFDFLIKLTLHLKLIFMIHQFIEIMDNISSKISNKQCPQLNNNEIIEYMNQEPQSSSIGYSILDGFSFNINNNTDFLKTANEFTNQINKEMKIDDFKALICELLNRSHSLLNRNFHQCGLKPILFSLNYHYRMIQAATSSMIPLLKTEPLDQIEPLQKIYIALNILLKRFSSLEGKDIELGIVNDLSFSLIMQIKDAYHEVKLKSSYKGTSSFQTINKYIKLFVKDLETIESAICFTHQVDFFIRELNIIDPQSGFNFDCQFCSPSKIDLSRGFVNAKDQIDPTPQNDSYDSIINELSFELHTYGYDMLPEKYSINYECDILAPNISKAIRIMLNYGDYIQIQKLIENPLQLGDEERLFSLVNDIYREIIDKPQSGLQLKEAVCVYIDTYFLLKALSHAGKIDFVNAVHLMYFRTHASIIFNDSFVGKVSLISPFEPSSHPCYRSILKRLTNLVGLKQINDEISHIRLFFFKFAGDVYKLDPYIISSNLAIFTHIFEWFSNPMKDSNDKFLTSKYLVKVKELKNSFAEIISKIRQSTNENKKNFIKLMREIELVLDSIINVQIHYIQFKKIELLMPFLRSFFDCQEDDTKFCNFISFYPVWFNSIHRCVNYNLIKCDEELLINSFKSTAPNVIENCEKLINSFSIQYQSFFNELSSCSSKLNEQSISMMIDLIVRGSFSFENVAKLIHYALKYFISSSKEPESLNSSFYMDSQASMNQPYYMMNLNKQAEIKLKINDFMISPSNFELWKNIIKLSCLLISLNLHPFLRRKLNINLLRMINMKNYINSYINGFHYLQSSALSVTFNKESSQNILLTFKDLQNIISEMPINVKTRDTYSKINRIISIVSAANRYLCETSLQKDCVDNVESYIANIQDKKIREAYKSSLRVALVSGASSPSATFQLTNPVTGATASAAQEVISNGSESIFYNKNDENYLDGMTADLNEYLDDDDYNFRMFIKKNSDSNYNSNYFSEDEDIDVNVVSCALNTEIINICFSDDERAVENYAKAIDSINLLSLYLTIVKEAKSFTKFATFDISSFIRMTPPFAICKPLNWEKSDNTRSSMLTVNLNQNSQQNQQQQQQLIENERSARIQNPVSDWLKSDSSNHQTVINNGQKQLQRQVQIIPIQYAFSDTGISSSKLRLKILYSGAQQALKNPIPLPRAASDFNYDRPLPKEIQQALIDQIEDNQNGLKCELIEKLKQQRREEQKEMQRKQRESQQKSGRLQVESENEEEEKHITSPPLHHEIVDLTSSKEEEEDKADNEPNNDENDGSEFQDDAENEGTEVKRGRGRTRGRGRGGRRRGGGRGMRAKIIERSASDSSIGQQGSSAVPLLSSHCAAPATKALNDLKMMRIKLSQLENEDAKAREVRDNMSRIHSPAKATIARISEHIGSLSEASSEVVKKKDHYYELITKFKADMIEYAFKKDILKQSQNTGKGYTLSNAIAQKEIDNHAKAEASGQPDDHSSEMMQKVNLGYSLFNPFKLSLPSKSGTDISVPEKSDLSEKVENDQIDLQNEIEKQRKEEILEPNELIALHKSQIASIVQRQNKLKLQKSPSKTKSSLVVIDDAEAKDNLSQETAKKEVEESRQSFEESAAKLSQNQQVTETLDEIKDKEILEASQQIGQLFDQESPGFTSLPVSLQKLTKPCWACLSKEELDQNSSGELPVQEPKGASDSEKVDDFELSKKRNLIRLSLNGQSDRLLNENPSDLQQRLNNCTKRISSLSSLVSDLNIGKDDANKIKSSSSSRKQSRSNSEKIKNDSDSNSKNNNDITVLSEADVGMSGENDVGFKLDNDIGFGFETDDDNEF